MEEFKNIDDFLAKWASGDLSENEREAFRKTKDYKLYAAILEGTDNLDLPAYDSETNYGLTLEKINKKGKIVHLVPKWAYAVAASIALLFGYFIFFAQTGEYRTGYGERLTVALPDGSEAILNSRSGLEYSKKNWDTERTVMLRGEAYFKVKKGATFTVDSKYGKVTVLGTQFTVNSEEAIFEVVCYEGKVQVEKDTRKKVLSKGQGIRAIGTKFESCNPEHDAPSWLGDETTFHNAQLRQVISALEKQYGITINLNGIDGNQRFTGGFTHKDLKTALRTVFEPLEIRFTFTDEDTIDLVQE